MKPMFDMRFASLLALTVLANMGMGIVMPVLPLYFQQHDVTTVGLSAPFATLVVGRLLSRAFAPSWIAGAGHRRVIMASFALYAVVFTAYLAAANMYHFAVLRLLEGIVEGVLAVALNDLAIAYTQGMDTPARVRAMGRFGAAFGLGFLLGPLVGSAVAYVAGLQAIFVASAVLGAAAVVLASRQVFDAPAQTARAAQLAGLRGTALLIGVYSPQCLRRLVFFALMILLPLYLADQLRLAPERIGLFFSMSAVITIVVMPVAGAVAKRVGAQALVVAGLAVMGSALLLFGFARDLYVFLFLFVVETLAFALMLPPAMSVFGDVVDSQARRTQILGAMAFATEVISLPLAVILPACYVAAPALAWGAVASMAFVSLVAFVGSCRRWRHHHTCCTGATEASRKPSWTMRTREVKE